MKKRVLSLFMALALCMTMLPTAVWAEMAGAAEETPGGADSAGVYTVGEDTAGEDAPTPDEAESGGAAQAAQALIDALPDEVTAENADEIAAQLMAIDEALAALTEEQAAGLDMARYEAICAALAGLTAEQAGTHSTHALCTHGDGCTICPDEARREDVFTDAKALTAKEGVLYIGGTAVTPTSYVTVYTTSSYYALPEGSYYLGGDIEIDALIQIDGTVNLCLNGHSITKTTEDISDEEGVIRIKPGVSFSLCDCKDGGKITHAEGKIGRGVCVGTVSGSATFNMFGGEISGNHAGSTKQGQDGGGVYAYSGGSFTMYGGEISGNTAPKRGGGICANGETKIYGGTIKNNTAGMYGGGMQVSNELTISDEAVITGNTAANGGGVCYYGFTSYTMTVSGSAKIEQNTATENGGGVYIASCEAFKVSGDISITGNKVGSADGNVYLSTDKYITVTGALTNTIGVTTQTEPTLDEPVKIAASSKTHTLQETDKANFTYEGAGEGQPEYENGAIYLKVLPHEHPICGAAHTDIGDHTTDTCAKKTWTAWDGVSDIVYDSNNTAYVYLVRSAVRTETLTVAEDHTLYLCLNGHSITTNKSTSAITVGYKATLSLCDCSAAQTGEITHGTDSANGFKYEGHGVNLGASATFNMYGGSITGNEADIGGGVELNYERYNCKFNMYGGSITNNVADNGDGGGGVHVLAGTFTMYGGSITGNKADTRCGGGGVYLAGAGEFIMKGGTIANNTAKYGGGVYTNVNLPTGLTVSGDVTITGNKNTNDQDENVYLASGKTIGIGTGGLGENASIGVTCGDTIASGSYVTVATGANKGYTKDAIFSDLGGDYGTLQEGDNVNLYNGLPHRHPICGEVCTHLDADGKPMHPVVEWTAVSSFSDQHIAGGHYYLTDNVETGLTLVPTGNVDLCLNGHTLRNTQTADVITVNAGFTVTLCDCDTTGAGGKIYGDGSDKAHGVYLNEGTFNMYGGTITAREYGVYLAQPDSTFNMYGGTISGSGTGVYIKVLSANTAAFNMYGGTITGNGSNSDAAGGVYVGSGTFRMSGGAITGNHNGEMVIGAGGVYVGGGTFEMSGDAVISNNSVTVKKGNNSYYIPAGGGGVYLVGATFKMSGNAKITGNTVSIKSDCTNGKGAGGVYVCSSGSFTVSDNVNVTGNTGGNVYLTDGKTITVDGLDGAASIGVSIPAAVSANSFVTVATGAAAGNMDAFSSDAGYDKTFRNGDILFTNGSLHEHAACGANCGHGTTHSDELWQPLTYDADTQTLYCGGKAVPNTFHRILAGVDENDKNVYIYYRQHNLPSGNYYLAENIALNGGTIGEYTTKGGLISIEGYDKDVKLCLNGFTLSATNDNTPLIGIAGTNKLTLSDCKGGGKVQTAAGGYVVVQPYGVDGRIGTFTMYGGTISGAQFGVWAAPGNFNMFGGTITGNECGVQIGSSGSITIGGTVNITGNTKENLFLPKNVLLSIDPSLTQASRIGISSSLTENGTSPIKVATGATEGLDYNRIFTADAAKNGYVVTKDDAGNLSLMLHQHSWEYAPVGTDTIKATCVNTDNCPNSDGGSVTISAPAHTVYGDGNECYALLTPHDWVPAHPADAVSYKQGGETLAEAPTNAGSYTACLTIGGVTAYVEYTIAPAAQTLTFAKQGDQTAVYGDTLTNAAANDRTDGSAVTYASSNEKVAVVDANSVVTAKGVGTATITASAAEKTGCYSAAAVSYELTVTARPITVTVTPASREYGAENPVFEASVTDGALVNGDTIESLGLGLSTEADKTYGVGSYDVTGDGTYNSNYSVTVIGTGALTVTARPITVTVTPASRKYGAENPVFTARVTDGSLVNGDTIESLGLGLSTTADKTYGVGSYNVTGDGTYNSNYNVTVIGKDALTVTPRPVAITGLSAADKIYDGDTAATVTGTAAVEGLVNGDDVRVDTTNAKARFADADVGTGKTVVFSGYALTGSGAANYVLTVQPASVTADITPAVITVMPDGVSKTYGTANDPALTYTYAGAANGETAVFDGALARAAGENAGKYEIGIGTLALKDSESGSFKAGNYVLALSDAKVYFTINKAVHDDENAAGSAMYGNAGTVELDALIAAGGTAVLSSTTDADGVLDGMPSLDGSTLRFAFRNEPDSVGKTVRITVSVTGADNYENYTISVTVTVAARIVPTGAPVLSPAQITYGQRLSAIRLSGAMKDGETVVDGVFAWDDPETILSAGTSAAAWTFTPNGSSYATVNGTSSVTVNKAALTDVSVRQDGVLTYTGAAQTAQVITAATAVNGQTVRFSYSLTKDGVYGSTVPGVTGAGSYTVYYKAEADNHETVSGSFTVTVEAAELRNVSVTAAELAYNGKAQTADVTTAADTADGSPVRFTYSTEENGTYGNAVPSFLSVGTRTVWFKAEADNHKTAAGSFAVTIGKAQLTVPDITVDITNGHAAAYSVDIRAAVEAALPAGCQLGTVQYGGLNFNGDEAYYDVMTSDISRRGVLTLAVNKVDSTVEGQVATVTVPVESGNYQEIYVTVKLRAVNKIVPTGAPMLSRASLTYGEKLSDIRLSGNMRDGYTVVRGTFTWTEPYFCPAAGSYDAEWVFTPEDDGKYAVVSGTSAITVKEPVEKTFTLGGTVVESSITGSDPDHPAVGATVTIRKGVELYGQPQLTDAKGQFSVEHVLPGVYNVVVEHGGKIVTAKVEIIDKNETLIVSIPREQVNSELEITDPTDLTESTVVGGLDDEAGEQFPKDNGDASVSISMEITEQPRDEADTVQNTIRDIAKDKVLDFIDMTLTMVKNGERSELKDTATVLEIIISYDTDRSGITVVRHHVDANGKTEAMSLTESMTGAEGTFYVDKDNKCIHIFASKFSTYAIGYTQSSGGNSSTSGSGSVSPATGDAGMMTYAAMALSSCTGTALLLRRRKRED